MKKRYISITVILIFGFVLLYRFIYLPKLMVARKLEAEYRQIKGDIDELYRFIARGKDMEGGIIDMRSKLEKLEMGLPYERNVSGVIRKINGEARQYHISILSLKPGNIEPYYDESGNEVKIGAYLCKRMPLTLDIESRYRNLGEFLDVLQQQREPVVTIETVNIQKDRYIAPRLPSRINMTVYLCGE